MLLNTNKRKRAKLSDALFRNAILVAGITTILCVLAMLWSILRVAFPLFNVNTATQVPYKTVAEPQELIYVSPDDYLETITSIHRSGEIFLQNLATGAILEQSKLGIPDILSAKSDQSGHIFIQTEDGAAYLWEVLSQKSFTQEGDKLHILKKQKLSSFPSLQEYPGINTQHDILYDIARPIDDTSFIRLTVLANKHIYLYFKGVSTNFLGEEEAIDQVFQIETQLESGLSRAFLSRDARFLYLVDHQNKLEYFSIESIIEGLLDGSGGHESTIVELETQGDRKVSALATIFGDTSLILGFDDGLINVYSHVKQELQKINQRQTKNGPIYHIVSSQREKSFFTLGEKGGSLWYLTNLKHVLDMNAAKQGDQAYFNPNGQALMLLGKTRASLWKIHAPYSDFSLRSIFSKTHYESYPEPAYIWQSSAGIDDFEPKYSFIPLIIGSIKGTLYAMLFALPLAILGAIYINQFAKPWLRNIVKPSVEVMATIPSVVIGFLAALWFAPIVEKKLLLFFLYLFCYPIIFFFNFLIFSFLANRFKSIKMYFKDTSLAFLLVMPSVILCFLAVWSSSGFLEHLLFQGDFIFWLSQNLNIDYEQRNAIIIAFALGFAVIPIIFTMTDEALSSFPRTLLAASLALGANYWQTLVRVILPSSASGIFAGFIIGFGRAIGETMIVLMATGNSPLSSWSLFNGMRTLSANIAVEIPEAPHGASLYRILFLSAVLLFILTFTLNLIAELIRNRLRKKYQVR